MLTGSPWRSRRSTGPVIGSSRLCSVPAAPRRLGGLLR
jgi:hypothetical protein